MNIGWRVTQYEKNATVSYNDFDVFLLLPDGSYVQYSGTEHITHEAEPKMPEEELMNMLGDDSV